MVEQVFGEVVVTTPSRQAIRRHHHQRITGFGQWLWEKAGFGHGAGGVDIAAVFQEKVNDLEAAVASGLPEQGAPIRTPLRGQGRDIGDSRLQGGKIAPSRGFCPGQCPLVSTVGMEVARGRVAGPGIHQSPCCRSKVSEQFMSDRSFDARRLEGVAHAAQPAGGTVRGDDERTVKATLTTTGVVTARRAFSPTQPVSEKALERISLRSAGKDRHEGRVAFDAVIERFDDCIQAGVAAESVEECTPVERSDEWTLEPNPS